MNLPRCAEEPLKLGLRNRAIYMQSRKRSRNETAADSVGLREHRAATVQDVVFRGAYYAYELTLPAQDALLFAYTQVLLELPADGRVGLDWEPSDATVLRDGA